MDLGDIRSKMVLNIDNFSSNLKRAEEEIQETEKKFSGFEDIGNRMQGVGTKLTMGLTLPIVGAGVAVTKTAMDFEKGMSGVKALLGATGEDMGKLKQQALDLGATTAFSASEAAEGMQNLASAGFTTVEIMAAMPGMLDLAASSGTDLAVASDIAASALRGFGLEADQAQRVADVFAKTSAVTNAGVTDLGEAMKYVAPVAGAAGISIEECSAAIGELANVGIKGSQAGTTLRSSMLAFATPTDKAAAAMKDMGFNAYDANGKMKSLQDIVGGLKSGMEGMTDEQKQYAIQTIFGTEAMSGMLALVDAGPDKLGELTKGLQDSKGSAAEMAETMQDNLAGSMDQLGGSVETLAISFGDVLAPTVRKIADTVSGLATKFNSLTKEQKQTVVHIALVLASLGPMLLIFAKTMKLFGEVAQGITLLVKGFKLLKGAIDIVKIAGAVVSFSPWIIAAVALAGIAYYVITHWSEVVKFFSDMVKNIATWWTNLNTSLDNISKKIGDSVNKTFFAMGDFILGIVKAVVDFFVNGWKNMNSFLDNTGKNMEKNVNTAFTNMLNGISTTVGNIAHTISNGFNGAIAFIKGLPAQAVVWGKDFVQGLITGITGMLGKVTDAVSAVAAKIKSFLHFSVPDEGPLTDYESWMPDFIDGMSRGIDANKHKLISSVKDMATGMKFGMRIDSAASSTTEESHTSGGGVTQTIGTLLHADKIEIRNDQDIEKLATQLAFYMKKSNLAMGVV